MLWYFSTIGDANTSSTTVHYYNSQPEGSDRSVKKQKKTPLDVYSRFLSSEFYTPSQSADREPLLVSGWMSKSVWRYCTETCWRFEEDTVTGPSNLCETGLVLGGCYRAASSSALQSDLNELYFHSFEWNRSRSQYDRAEGRRNVNNQMYNL